MNTFHLAAGCASLLALTVTVAGCQQSASDVSPNAPVLAPSADLSAKTEHTIKILSGELVYVSVSPGARLDLKGTAGFRLATGNAYGPGYPPTGCYPCGPGTLALNGQPNSYSDLVGTAKCAAGPTDWATVQMTRALASPFQERSRCHRLRAAK